MKSELLEDVPVAAQKLRESLSHFAHSSSAEYASPSRKSPRLRMKVERESEVRVSITPPSDSPKRRNGSLTELGSGRSPVKKKRGYAPPETYAHLNVLQDYLERDLDVMFCGINPGKKSAEVGHHFANPTNHFWRCLHQSGLTDRLLLPSEEHLLPGDYDLGLTDLVDRPSIEQAELSVQEMTDSVPNLIAKIIKHRPRIVCFVGKGIWLIVEKGLKALLAPVALPGSQMPSPSTTPRSFSTPSPSPKSGKMRKIQGLEPTGYGLQPYKVLHSDDKLNAATETLFFVSPSTSGRVTSHQLPDKVKLFAELRQHVLDQKAGSLDTMSMATILR